MRGDDSGERAMAVLVLGTVLVGLVLPRTTLVAQQRRFPLGDLVQSRWEATTMTDSC
jgi:hypothetical protein